MKLLALFFSIFIMNSCSSSKANKYNQDDAPLTGKYKVLTIEGVVSNLPDDLTITFNEENNNVRGFNGCNGFSGSFKQTETTLTIGTLIATQRYCDGERGVLEKHFMRALGQTKSIQNTKDRLTLFGDGDLVLIQAERLNEMDHVKAQETYNISYKAVARGVSKMINIKGNVLSVQNNRNSIPKTMVLSEIQLDSITEKLQDIDLKTLETLPSPSKAHQHDGALSAYLKIEHLGSTYQTPSFDHGNPPKAIKTLVEQILSLSEKVE